MSRQVKTAPRTKFSGDAKLPNEKNPLKEVPEQYAVVVLRWTGINHLGTAIYEDGEFLLYTNHGKLWQNPKSFSGWCYPSDIFELVDTTKGQQP